MSRAFWVASTGVLAALFLSVSFIWASERPFQPVDIQTLSTCVPFWSSELSPEIRDLKILLQSKGLTIASGARAALKPIFNLIAQNRRFPYGIKSTLPTRRNHESNTDGDLWDRRELYDGKNGILVVVYDSAHEPVATAALLRIQDEGVIEIRKMGVRSEYRGIGLGEALLRYLVVTAFDWGFDQIELDTNREMIESVGLYRKVGFKEVAAQNIRSPGKSDCKFILEKANYVAR